MTTMIAVVSGDGGIANDTAAGAVVGTATVSAALARMVLPFVM